MQMRKGLLLGLAVCGIVFGLVLGGVLLGKQESPKQAAVTTPKASVPVPVVDETLRLLSEASTTLSKVGPALDYPMSESEIADSQDQVEDARQELLASGSKSTSLLQARDLADESLDLANQALESARDGKRERALKRFTRARIKMQEARLAVDPGLTADQRRSLASSEIGFPPPSADQPNRKSSELFSIRGKEGNGGIFLGPDGLRIEGRSAGEHGAINIGPDGVHIRGRDGSDTGSVHIAPDGVTFNGND